MTRLKNVLMKKFKHKGRNFDRVFAVEKVPSTIADVMFLKLLFREKISPKLKRATLIKLVLTIGAQGRKTADMAHEFGVSLSTV